MVDTMITLFESTAIEFQTNGIGRLPDAMECIITEERNGSYELELVYPITGKRYREISLRKILFVKPSPYASPQPFRIYSISKTMDGSVSIHAAHISYDLSGYPVSAFEADNIQNALLALGEHVVGNCPFHITSDMGVTDTMVNVKPVSFRSLIGGDGTSILSIYGGECEFDGFDVKIWNSRGENRGVSIRYGKNLTDITQDENCSQVYTGIYPYWYSEDAGLLELPEKVLSTSATYDFVSIMSLDLTSQLAEEWEGMPTEEALREAAVTYMEDNKIGIPKGSITVSFVDLGQFQEYQEFSLLQRVHLCDTVNVSFPELNVNATAQCIATTYNVLTNRYDEIQLGDATPTLVSTLVSQNKEITNKPTKTTMQQAIENATQQIVGGLGGHVVLHSSTGGKQPDEILIMDTDNTQTALNVWRWNKNGLGYSSKGYNGPYGLAMTQDGSIVADFITTGTLTADIIKTGVFNADLIKTGTLSADRVDGGVLSGVEIKIANGTFHVDENGNVSLSGNINLSEGSINWGGNGPVKYQFSVNGTSGWHDVMGTNDKYRRDSLNGGTSWGSPYQFRGVNGSNGSDGSDASVNRKNIEIALDYAKNLGSSFLAVDSVGSPIIYGGKIYGSEIYAGGTLSNGEVIGTGSVISLTDDGIKMYNNQQGTYLEIGTDNLPSLGNVNSIYGSSGTIVLNAQQVVIAYNPGSSDVIGMILEPYKVVFHGPVDFSNADVIGLSARFN